MPPKRVLVSTTQTSNKRRCSSRLNHAATDDPTGVPDVITHSKRIRRSAKGSKKDVCWEASNDKSTTSEDEELTVDVNGSVCDPVNDENEEPPPLPRSTINLSFGRASQSSTHGKSFDDVDDAEEDDDDRAFRETFMNVVPSFKVTSDRIVTPFSQHNHRSNGSNPDHSASSRRNVSPAVHSSIVSSQPTRISRESTAAHILRHPINSLAAQMSAGLSRINTSPIGTAGPSLPHSQSSISPVSTAGRTPMPNNTAVLETFPEYRNLQREFERAENKNKAWAADYKALTRRMQKLEQSTFPCPSTDGRLFLEQILNSLKTSEQDYDGRDHAELAADLGISAVVLASLTHVDPQRAALKVFNVIYPTNEEKDALINIGYLVAVRPKLLADLLAFARRCAPGSGYTMTMLREAIGNAIRCARHKLKHSIVHLMHGPNRDDDEPNDDDPTNEMIPHDDGLFGS